jgi:acetyl-CoA/propionyl-CoA carboxylase biotin carboxyl carrier protein
LKKILIANRSEIAGGLSERRDMGPASVAVWARLNDSCTRLADEAQAIGPDQASESYLRIDKLIEAARTTGADALHPGYGFLGEC